MTRKHSFLDLEGFLIKKRPIKNRFFSLAKHVQVYVVHLYNSQCIIKATVGHMHTSVEGRYCRKKTTLIAASSELAPPHTNKKESQIFLIHRKKRFTSFPSPAGMSLTIPLSRNNSVMTSLFPPSESLVVTSRLGTGNSRTFFYGVYKEIQSGAVAKSYMRKGFLIYEAMRKYFHIYEEAVSHI